MFITVQHFVVYSLYFGTFQGGNWTLNICESGGGLGGKGLEGILGIWGLKFGLVGKDPSG